MKFQINVNEVQSATRNSRRLGSPYERGGADAKHGRPYRPSKYNKLTSRITHKLTPEEESEYKAGYDAADMK